MKKIIALLLCAALCVALCAGLTGCETSDKENNFTVVTSFYPLYISALNITAGVQNTEVVNMAGQQTGCLHDYQLQNKDMKALETADVFVINGAGMESFLDKVTERLPDLSVIDASRGIPLIDENPHVWVSIEGCMAQVENIAEGLARADPANSELYLENARLYREKLLALKEKAREDLRSLKSRKIITMHEAFPYFAEEFDLEIAGVINREPDSQISAQQLGETIELVRKLGTAALFAEPQYEQSAADTIAAETGAKVYTLDPGVTGEETPDAYLTIMEKNIGVLKEALG